jgi:large subunit ribosomal protein L6
MMMGVTRGFEYKLKVAHSHFPITVKVDKDKRLVQVENFLGERTPRTAKIEGNVQVVVKGDDVIISGADRQAIGQTAANIERVCRIKDKDPRVFQDGIYLYEVRSGDELLKRV